MHECNYACVVLDCFQFFGCSCNGWWFGSLLDRSRVVLLLLSLSVVCSGLCGPDSSVTTICCMMTSQRTTSIRPTDAAVKATRQFCESRGLLRLVSRPATGGVILDLVVRQYDGIVTNLPHCGSSDHQTLLVTLARVLETPSTAPKRMVDHRKRAVWNHVVRKFKSINLDLPDNIEG